MNLINRIKRLAQDERGSFSVEAVLMFPLLAWAFMAMYVFFEGLRETNINLKATYTVSDLLSRTQDEDYRFGQDDLDGMHAIYAWLSRSTNPVDMRVSFVTYKEATETHNLQWSKSAHGTLPELTQDIIGDTIEPHIPILADGAGVIVVETWATYTPIIDMGLTETDIYNIVVTAPRFSGQLAFEGVGDGGGSEHDDGTDEDVDLET